MTELNRGEWPLAVTFRFRDAEEKHAFLAGLLDGWGENYCDMIWKRQGGVSFDSVVEFGVRPFYTRHGVSEIMSLLAGVGVSVSDRDVDSWTYGQCRAACEWAEALTYDRPSKPPKPDFLP